MPVRRTHGKARASMRVDEHGLICICVETDPAAVAKVEDASLEASIGVRRMRSGAT
jgi:hypothetical protein